MTDLPPLLLWLILGGLSYALVTSVFAVLAARAHFETRRHDLVVRSKKMRLEYLMSLDEKMAGVIDDDDPLIGESVPAPGSPPK